MKLVVARLADDLVDDLEIRIASQPTRDVLPELLALLRLGCGEDLYAGEHRALPSRAAGLSQRPGSCQKLGVSCAGGSGTRVSIRAAVTSLDCDWLESPSRFGLSNNAPG